MHPLQLKTLQVKGQGHRRQIYQHNPYELCEKNVGCWRSCQSTYCPNHMNDFIHICWKDARVYGNAIRAIYFGKDTEVMSRVCLSVCPFVQEDRNMSGKILHQRQICFFYYLQIHNEGTRDFGNVSPVIETFIGLRSRSQETIYQHDPYELGEKNVGGWRSCL